MTNWFMPDILDLKMDAADCVREESMESNEAMRPTGEHVRYALCKGCQRHVKRDDMRALNLRFYDADNRERRVRVRLCEMCWMLEAERAQRLAWDGLLLARVELDPALRPVECEADLFCMAGVSDRKAYERRVHNDTNCDVWVKWMDDGIVLGCSVDGADECPAHRELLYPFVPGDLEAALAGIEGDAHRIWLHTHGCEKCWPEGHEFRDGPFWPVNPECEGCNGEGVAR